MGGRGSCYLNFFNTNREVGVENNFNYAEDEDTKKEYNGKTKKLRNKDIHIKKSTDDLLEEVFIPNIKKIDSLSRKYPISIEMLDSTDNKLNIHSTRLEDGAVACFSSGVYEFGTQKIIFNSNLKKRNKSDIQEMTKRNIKSHNWMPVDNKEMINYAITHEYGHYIQRILKEQYIMTPEGRALREEYVNKTLMAKNKAERTNLANEFEEKFATRCFKQIQRIHRKEFGKEDINMISRYGIENGNSEIFAELFTHLNNSKNPNTLAKSLKIYLEKHIKVKDKTTPTINLLVDN